MKTVITMLMMLLTPSGAILLDAAEGRESVLIVLRQLEGPVGKRLAAIPQSVNVPAEVKAVAEQERASMAQAQRESFDMRLGIAGATGVVHYAGLDMLRAEVPVIALPAIESDPAVLSLTRLSGNAAGAAIGKQESGATAIQSPLAWMPVAGAMPAAIAPSGLPPGGVVGEPPGRMPGVFQPAMAGGQMHGANPAFMQSMPMQGMAGGMSGGMAGGVPGNMLGASFAAPPPGFSGGGTLFQSLLGVTSQIGAQAGMVVPRAAGIMLLISGSAQVAQMIAANRKQSCTITLDSTTVRIPAAGGQGAFVVNASPSCLWQAQSHDDWLHIDTDGPVVGPGVVRYTVSAGTGRSGAITIAGIAKMTIKGKTSVTVSQAQ